MNPAIRRLFALITVFAVAFFSGSDLLALAFLEASTLPFLAIIPVAHVAIMATEINKYFILESFC
jgi:hypothetical protein